jgi:hypothetical protein
MPRAERQNRSVTGELPTPDPNEHSTNFTPSINVWVPAASWPTTRLKSYENEIHRLHTYGPHKKIKEGLAVGLISSGLKNRPQNFSGTGDSTFPQPVCSVTA